MKADATTAARGMIRVVNANMERAIRVITVERGHDPRDFALMAFGGAGPMHACELALDLGIRKIVLPRDPGLLCARGALGAPLGREYSITVRETAPDLRRLLALGRPLITRARAELIAHGAEPAEIKTDLRADVRYHGQSYEIEVTLGPQFVSEFHQLHRRTFGYAAPEAPIEVVNLRLRAAVAGPAVTAARTAKAKGKPAVRSKAGVIVGAAHRLVPAYAREEIAGGARIGGPAIVVELSATAYVSPEFTLRCDDFGNLHLEAH
jgi:N-methylhydantoinase A/oxoprolinase/acetone carboxylase beta subunit